ncbi:unnamed protein product, partial [marine sediment metagenome]
MKKNLLEKYLGEDIRGKVKIGSATLDTNIDFQRMILNQYEPSTSTTIKGVKYYGGSGMKNPLTDKEVEKIYKQSKQFWKDGGKWIKIGSKKVFIEGRIL